MKRLYRLGFAAVLALSLPGLALAADPPPAPDPAETVDAFHYALKAGDRKKVLELLAADVLVFEQGRLEQSRNEYAKRHLKEDMSFSAVTKRTVARRAVQLVRDVAWVTSVNRVTGKVNNREINLTTDETMVLRRVAGRWRIVHIHWSFSNKGGA